MDWLSMVMASRVACIDRSGPSRPRSRISYARSMLLDFTVSCWWQKHPLVCMTMSTHVLKLTTHGFHGSNNTISCVLIAQMMFGCGWGWGCNNTVFNTMAVSRATQCDKATLMGCVVFVDLHSDNICMWHRMWLPPSPIIFNNCAAVLVPFKQSYGDITLFIGN